MKSKFATPGASRQQCDAAAGHMCCWGCLRGTISHTQPLSYGNTIHLRPLHDLIHFTTTGTFLMMTVVGGTTAVPMKTTGLQQNLHSEWAEIMATLVFGRYTFNISTRIMVTMNKFLVVYHSLFRQILRQ